jgi:hypothetical protein
MRNRKGTQRLSVRDRLALALGRPALWSLVFGLIVTAPGCGAFRTRRPQAAAPPGELPTAEQVVTQINRNAERVHSLMAKDLDISSNQVPIPLDGKLALEKPRRFRLNVRMPATKTIVADIGSNDQEFWFYTAQPTQPAALIHCSYEDYGRVQARIPFQPDWIFDALGFMPLPTDQSHLIRPGKRGTVELVSPSITPQGQNASLITVVQLDTGWITERRMELPGRQKPLATASLSRHQKDPASGVVYPGTVKVAWPDEDLDITIRMQGVEVNPNLNANQALWQLPRNQYSAQDIDLGAGLRMNRAPSAQLGSPARRSRTNESAYPRSR